MNSKVSLLSYTREQFACFVRDTLGRGYEHAGLIYQEYFRTSQITGQHPAFKNAQRLFQEILDLIDLSLLPIVHTNQEGPTGKFLLKTAEGLEIESVLIPMQAGGTLCVSSQVGCRMGCAFCETGRMGLLRNLTAAEIVCQVFIARFLLNFDLRNIVFMGMGEPFDNYQEVMQAVRVLTDPHGFGFGCNHITISTSGCIEGIEKFIEEPEPKPNLAVSVNAPTNEIRNRLMPVNRKHDMQALYASMKNYCDQSGKQILAAYVLLKGINDSLEHADALATYLKGLNVKINLIPYNPQSNDRYQPPEQTLLDAFTCRLREQGYYTLLRQTKGQQIMAACGQLGNLKLKQLKKQIQETQ